jgi:SAM-dependent methyltransferase
MIDNDLDAPTRAGYGLEISAVRLDELDQQFLSRIGEWKWPDRRPRVLEIGCGSGTLAREAAGIGAVVAAIDARSGPTPIDDADHRISFFSASAPLFPEALESSRFDFVVSQRTLHYLTYPDCAAALRWCRRHAAPGARIFLGVSGISSELGDDYAAKAAPVSRRWGPLSPAMAIKHDIRNEVCLYASDELSELVTHCGFVVENCWLSTFGNVKLVAWCRAAPCSSRATSK